MARKNPVPKREREICRRLFDYRLRSRHSRATVAGELGVPVSRMASYEHGAVPVPYGFVKKLRTISDLNLEWLVEGVGNPDDEICIGPAIESEIPDKMLVSEAFDRFIKPALKEAQNWGQTALEKAADQNPESPYMIKPIRTIGLYDREMVAALLTRLIRVYVQTSPPHLLFGFYRTIMEAVHRFELKHSSGATSSPDSNPKRTDLTNSETLPIMSPVRSQLPSLLDRVRKAAEASGKKTELARLLNVPLASVSRWLSGEREPGGEYALQMLKWVEQEERKPK